jgi:succinoglycan biosynthesis protein ExoM
MIATHVTVIIPTFRRPGPLDRALRSVLAQDLDAPFEVLVVDNDPAGSARRQVEEIQTSVALRYVHAPEPGVANARNVGLAASTAPFIAFLDDDEAAPPGWLAALLDAQSRLAADVVFGPVIAKLPDDLSRHRPYFQAFYSRTGPREEGALDSGLGCGCSLLRRKALPARPDPFLTLHNEIGGEDDMLFSEMKGMGARFGWCPAAWVWEYPDPARLTLGYTLRREFARGQGPCSTANTRGGPRRWPTIAFWTLVGAGQVVIYGVLAALYAAIRSPRMAHALGRTAGGLGKIFWGWPFKIAFYGQRQTDQLWAAPLNRPTDQHLSPAS